jgi:hypothetical protein
MQAEEHEAVVADLIRVYQSAVESASEAAWRSRDTHLPMMERVAYRHQALQAQELADQALRMIDELSLHVAA